MKVLFYFAEDPAAAAGMFFFAKASKNEPSESFKRYPQSCCREVHFVCYTIFLMPKVHRKKIQPKILVVDDEPDITASFQSFFGRRGFLVNTAASGQDALNIIKTSKPDLVFLDLTLPEMHGKEVLKELREFDKKTKVIIVTGHALESEDEDKEFQSLGISAYLNKPIVLEKLVEIVELILENKFSARDFEKYKLIRKAEPPAISATAHRLKNLLGNMRNQCEVFLLNKRDGIFNDKPEKELGKMSEEIMQDVIKTVDQVMEVFEGIKEEK
jgi:CheY-like chemotaxis protein